MSNGLNQKLYQIKDSHGEYNSHDIDVIAKRWDQKATLWDEQLAQNGSHLNESNAYDSFLVEAKALTGLAHFGEHGRISVLEVGCGTGLVSDFIQRDNIDIIGIDVSKQMLQEASQKEIKNAKFVKADVFNLKAQNFPTFDLILSRGILLSHYSTESAEKLLRTVFEHGKPGYSVAMLDFLNEEATDSSHHRPTNKSYYSPEALVNIALKAGYKKCKFLGSSTDRVRFVALFF